MLFLQTLYPEPKPSLVNRYIFENIKDFDEIDKVEYDTMANLGIQYKSDADRLSILSKT